MLKLLQSRLRLTLESNKTKIKERVGSAGKTGSANQKNDIIIAIKL